VLALLADIAACTMIRLRAPVCCVVVCPLSTLQEAVIHEMNRTVGGTAAMFHRHVQPDGPALTHPQIAALAKALRSKRVMFYAKCELNIVRGEITARCVLAAFGVGGWFAT
jgi:hypothetical protein